MPIENTSSSYDLPTYNSPQMLGDEALDFEPLEFELPKEDGAVVTENPDGSVDVQLGPEDESNEPPSHGSNLAEHLDSSDLAKISSDLVHLVDCDIQSRKDWERAYIEGMSLLGLKIEERSEPWPGASGVFHPLMTEAVVRFQAQTITEIFPTAGPARTKIIGEETPEVVKQAKRVEQELNYLLTEVMTEFRSETEQMLFRLPLAGSAFKKIYYDPLRGRPVSMFVPAEDFIISYGASDLESCGRYTYRLKISPNDLKKFQVAGLYRDIAIPKPSIETSDIEKATDKIIGVVPSIVDDPDHTLYEIHVDYDMPGEFANPDGYGLPYVITIDKSSQKVLSVYRNWEEMDPLKNKVMHFAHYPYMPGLGFYGLGLTHLMGGLTKSATSILRQLIDAGTLSNLPGGLKTRGMRIQGDDTPILPGEWRDADVPSGTLRESLFPMPYKEPSLVLNQLLGGIIDEGRRVGSIADLQVGEMSQNTPVGTTLALLERSLKVMSAVQARVHWGLKNELRIISRIVKNSMGPKYAYNVGGDFNRNEDFGDPVDVIPVSDPNASTMSQRVVKLQAAMQMAASDPTSVNRKLLMRQAFEALDMPQIDKLIPIEEEAVPQDPATENMNMLMGLPTKVFYHQDHEAHIQVHMAAVNDPKIAQILQMSPSAQAVMGAANAHIMEHVAYAYRRQVEQTLGTTLPPPEQPLTPEQEVQYSRPIAQAAAMVQAQNQNEMAQRQALENAKDPVLQAQLMDAQTKMIKAQVELGKLGLDRDKATADVAETQAKIDSSENIAAMQAAVQIAVNDAKIDQQDRSDAAKAQIAAEKEIDRGAPKP